MLLKLCHRPLRWQAAPPVQAAARPACNHSTLSTESSHRARAEFSALGTRGIAATARAAAGGLQQPAMASSAGPAPRSGHAAAQPAVSGPAWPAQRPPCGCQAANYSLVLWRTPWQAAGRGPGAAPACPQSVLMAWPARRRWTGRPTPPTLPQPAPAFPRRAPLPAPARPTCPPLGIFRRPRSCRACWKCSGRAVGVAAATAPCPGSPAGQGQGLSLR